MAEYRKLPFSQFARDFFLYSTYFPLYGNEYASLDPKVFILHAKTVVFELSYVFSPFMRKYVFDKMKDKVLKTDEDLLRFLVPRCLKIFYQQNFYRSLLVAMAFIHEFLMYMQMNRLCYRFHFTASQVLITTFMRAYQKDWNVMGGWKGFQDEVKENIMLIRPYQRLDSINLVIQRSKFLDEIKRLLKKCKPNGQNDDDFVLNEFEQSMIAKDDIEAIYSESVDDDPLLKFDLTPSEDLMKEKVTAFCKGRDMEFGLQISLLIDVPPPDYEPPEGDSEDDEQNQPEAESDDDNNGSSNGNNGSSNGNNGSSNCNNGSSNDDNEESDDEDWDSESYPDIDIDYQYDKEYEFSLHSREFSEFEIYTSAMMKDALKKYGQEKFREKMMQRKCECCGIKCYQFSYDLFKNYRSAAVLRDNRD